MIQCYESLNNLTSAKAKDHLKKLSTETGLSIADEVKPGLRPPSKKKIRHVLKEISHG